ncbi:mechanosensitive ion channel family protein [Chloroflexota bacterium]
MDWTPIIDWLLQYGTRILIILLIGIGLWFTLKKLLPPLVRRAVARTREKESKAGMEKRTKTIVGVFMGVGKISIGVIIVFMILSELDIPIGPALAGLGIVGVAVGFGAQWLIRDLIAGTFILMENQYRVGDVIRVADVAGGVEEVSLRKTVLRDLDGIVHNIPNGEIRVASNFTRHWSRAHLNISVAYKEDLDRVMAIIRKIWEEIAADPDWGSFLISKTPWLLRVDAFGDSGIVIKVVGETQPIKQWDVMGELRRRIKKVFDEEGIEIPWPHTKVYFGDSPEQTAVEK